MQPRGLWVPGPARVKEPEGLPGSGCLRGAHPSRCAVGLTRTVAITIRCGRCLARGVVLGGISLKVLTNPAVTAAALTACTPSALAGGAAVLPSAALPGRWLVFVRGINSEIGTGRRLNKVFDIFFFRVLAEQIKRNHSQASQQLPDCLSICL